MSKFDSIVSTCRFLLNNSPDAAVALEYLNGRLAPEAQELFSFGYFPNSRNVNLLTSSVSEEKLKKIGLMYEYSLRDSLSARTVHVSFFENHPLVMPYRNVYGDIIGLVGRSLLSDEERSELGIAKYKNTEFKKGEHVFGLYEAKSSILEKDFVYVVEGQFDVIKAMEKGIRNIVAVGSTNLTDYQLSLICRYTKNIFLLFDSDEAGEKGRVRAQKLFGQLANLSSVYLPSGYKDIDEYLKQHDGDSLTFVVRNAKYSL